MDSMSGSKHATAIAIAATTTKRIITQTIQTATNLVHLIYNVRKPSFFSYLISCFNKSKEIIRTDTFIPEKIAKFFPDRLICEKQNVRTKSSSERFTKSRVLPKKPDAHGIYSDILTSSIHNGKYLRYWFSEKVL